MVATADRHPRSGETVTGGELHLFPGGKGANQAVAAHRADGETQLVGPGKDDFGDRLEAFLCDAGLGLDHLEREPKLRTGGARFGGRPLVSTCVRLPQYRMRAPADVWRRQPARILAMDAEARVCTFCGMRPGVGMFCEACGRNLQAVDRLPTRAEWEGERVGERRPSAAGMHPLVERCANATATFLAAMREAGNPGAVRTPVSKRSAFRRGGWVRGWVLHPVDREDFEKPRRYEPGLVLTVEGRFHRLHSELRGWGTRDFPHYHHTVEPDPIDMPATERLVGELAAMLRIHGVGDTETSAD